MIKKKKIFFTSFIAFGFFGGTLISFNGFSKQNNHSSFNSSINNGGFNIKTPTYDDYSSNIFERHLLHGEFSPTNQPNIDSSKEDSYFSNNYPRTPNFSKTIVSNNKYNIIFDKTALGNTGVVDQSEPTAILSTGLDGNSPENNRWEKYLLEQGTGQPNSFESSIHNGVRSAILIDNKLWLLTSGSFANNQELHLICYRITDNRDNPFTLVQEWDVSNLYDKNQTFKNFPLVISPIYIRDKNNNIYQDSTQMMVFQQNVDFNTMSTKHGIKIFKNGAIEPKEVRLAGFTDSNTHRVISINAIQQNYNPFTEKDSDSMIYIVNNSINDWIGDQLSYYSFNSSFSPWFKPHVGDYHIHSSFNLTNLNIDSELSYMKIFQNINQKPNIDLFYFIPLPNSGLQNLSSNFNLDDYSNFPSIDVHKNNFDQNIKWIQYTDIGSYLNKNAAILFSTEDSSKNTNLKLLSINDLKNDAFDTTKNFNMDSFSNINPDIDKNKILNSAYLSNVNDDNISFSFQFGSRLLDERRSIKNNLNNFSKYLNYDTQTPIEIIAQQNSSSDLDIKNFTKDNIQQLISNSTKNLISHNSPSRWVTAKEEKYSASTDSWDVKFSYDNGSWKNGQYISTTNEHESFIYQQKFNSTIKLSVSFNQQYPKNSDASKFSDEINKLLPTGGFLNSKWQEDPYLSKIIGSESSNIFQISKPYLSSLRQISASADNFKGIVNISLMFNSWDKNNNLVLHETVITLSGFSSVLYILSISIPVISIVLIIILISVFIYLQKKKKLQLSKALGAGFALSKKMSEVNEPTESEIENSKKPEKKIDKINKDNSSNKLKVQNDASNKLKFHNKSPDKLMSQKKIDKIDQSKDVNNLKNQNNSVDKLKSQNPISNNKTVSSIDKTPKK